MNLAPFQAGYGGQVLRILPILVAALASVATIANAAAVREASQFTTVFPGNDDSSTANVPLGFSINFLGGIYNSLWVNNNGNVTFDSPLSSFTPFSLLSTSRVIIAPFFADVDTRPAASIDVTYGQGVVDGRPAFGVNWIDVGFFYLRTNPLNSFQLILIDRSDIGAGDFDIEFNYDRILWEAGEASGGNASGLGGFSARAGFSNGSTFAFELPGSAVNGGLLDGNAITGLINNRLNSSVDGRYVFRIRNGAVVVPAPAALALFGLGIAALGLRRR